MKRHGNLIQKIADINNIELADKNARKGKLRSKKYIQKHDENHTQENQKLSKDLLSGNFQTSKYQIYKIYEPKEREIYRLPYYPDRIAQHAILNVLEPIWTSQFIPTTYSCIKGRGIHKCLKDIKRDLYKYPDKTTYCLKFDIKKFYPSINHAILKKIIRRKIKDKILLKILDNIIDSAKGVPIGNYLSQFFANLYLTPLDIECKHNLKCRFYYRYADDIVILSDSKEFLHNVFTHIQNYLNKKLDLQIKWNYQIFPVDNRGIDFVGYVIRHKYVILRKSIKRRLLKKLFQQKNLYKTLSSYYGWLKYCNSVRLRFFILDNLSKELKIKLYKSYGQHYRFRSFDQL